MGQRWQSVVAPGVEDPLHLSHLQPTLVLESLSVFFNQRFPTLLVDPVNQKATIDQMEPVVVQPILIGRILQWSVEVPSPWVHI